MDGQTVEHKQSNKVNGLYHPYSQSQPASLHYSKGFGLDRPQWYGNESHGQMGVDFGSMMWPPTSSMGSNNGAGLHMPSFESGGSTPNAQGPAPLVCLDGNNGSPILSSPPSSNVSSSSSQSYAAAGYGLMVPPTVPSHAVGNEAAASNLVDFHSSQAASTKLETMEGSHSSDSFHGNAYAPYSASGSQFSSWNDAGAPPAYVPASPSPPPSAPAATPAHAFDLTPWHQSSMSG